MTTVAAAASKTASPAQTLKEPSGGDKPEQTSDNDRPGGNRLQIDTREVAVGDGAGPLDCSKAVDFNHSATDDEKASANETFRQMRVGSATEAASEVSANEGGGGSRRISIADSLPSRTQRRSLSSEQVSGGETAAKAVTAAATRQDAAKGRRSVAVASTVAADNKKRPIVLAQTAVRFAPEPELESGDSQSVAKSEALRRIQANLEEWDGLLGQIENGKARSDQLMRYEVEKREKTIEELKSDIEGVKKNIKDLNEEKSAVTGHLETTSSNLAEREAQIQDLDQRLQEYETAYEEMTNAKEQLEGQLDEMARSLTEKDNINRRLNEQNTELQAQLEIEMQRSKTCLIL
eukprot:m.24381 g.24381  ORF g.24381 m.24381 type:complete len:349 (+) comp28615_c0_seq2:543-1589(+)